MPLPPHGFLSLIQTFQMNDPYIARKQLITHILKQCPMSGDKSAIETDLQILNAFVLAKDWTKVLMFLDRWAEHLKDPQADNIKLEWHTALEIAIDGSDIEFLKLLLPFVGKHKKLRVRLPVLALALEKQNHKIIDLLLKHLHYDLEETSILSGLSNDEKQAYQELFNRYCVASDDQVMKELLKDLINAEITKSEKLKVVTEHKLAMITYLSKNTSIVLTESTMWDCINRGNFTIWKFLETLKDISIIGWMEPWEEAKETIPADTISNHTIIDTEYYSTMLALYSAYGGNLSGIDAETQSVMTIQYHEAPKSFANFLGKKGAPRRFSTSLEVPSERALRIIQSKDDDYWTRYLTGEIENPPSLPWIEPCDEPKRSLFTEDSDASIAEDPENFIFEGLSGVTSRRSSVISRANSILSRRNSGSHISR